jgi:hypothetical protein
VTAAVEVHFASRLDLNLNFTTRTKLGWLQFSEEFTVYLFQEIGNVIFFYCSSFGRKNNVFLLQIIIFCVKIDASNPMNFATK